MFGAAARHRVHKERVVDFADAHVQLIGRLGEGDTAVQSFAGRNRSVEGGTRHRCEIESIRAGEIRPPIFQ